MKKGVVNCFQQETQVLILISSIDKDKYSYKLNLCSSLNMYAVVQNDLLVIIFLNLRQLIESLLNPTKLK